jgi:hypothetical protein
MKIKKKKPIKVYYASFCEWCDAEIVLTGTPFYLIQKRTKGKSKTISTKIMCENCYNEIFDNYKKKQEDWIVQNEKGQSGNSDAGLPESTLRDSEERDGVRSDRDSLREQIRSDN